MNSIRVFLVVVTLAVMTIFTFVAALKGFQSSMQEADRLFDKQLLDVARLIASIHAEDTSANASHDSDFAFQVWDGERLLAASANAPETAIAPLEPGFDYSNFEGYRWRTVAYRDVESRRWVLAAERTDLRFTLAENVILESIFPLFLGLPIVGILIWIIVSQGLKPLRQLATELGNRQASDLGPLPIQAPKRELEQIVASSNALLRRLETSLLREKQFASDAAHELRTPISALKVQIYNLGQELPQDDEAVAGLAQTVARLEHIVEQILDLYRSSPDRFTASIVPIDLAALAQDVLAEEFGRFDARNQALEFVGESATIQGDRFALTTLLVNLLSNASKYTPPGGSIRVEVSRADGCVTLCVEDSGPGIPDDQRQSVFERFYRVGRDRHGSGEPGCGLGLAIVRRIVELHGATIEIGDSRFDPGTAVRVQFSAETGESPVRPKEQPA